MQVSYLEYPLLELIPSLPMKVSGKLGNELKPESGGGGLRMLFNSGGGGGIAASGDDSDELSLSGDASALGF